MLNIFKYFVQTCLVASVVTTSFVNGHAADGPEYQKQVAPILTKYCAGCHNPDDAAGESTEKLYKTGEVLAESGISRQMLYRYMQMELVTPAETTETLSNLVETVFLG